MVLIFTKVEMGYERLSTRVNSALTLSSFVSCFIINKVGFCLHVGQNSDFLSKFFQILPDEVILLTSVILETDFPE